MFEAQKEIIHIFLNQMSYTSAVTDRTSTGINCPISVYINAVTVVMCQEKAGTEILNIFCGKVCHKPYPQTLLLSA